MTSAPLRVIHLEAAVDELLEALSDDIVLFVGAGISVGAPTSCPAWTDLTKQFLQALVRAGGVDDDGSIHRSVEHLPPLMMAAFRRPEHTFQVLQDVLGSEVLEGLAVLRTGAPNTNHFSIAGYIWIGALRAVLTTNFDQLLEETAQLYAAFGTGPSQSARRPLRFIYGPKVSARESLNDSRILWMLHGSLAETSSMLATIKSVGKDINGEITMLFRSLLEQYTVLVVRYSGNDEDIIRAFLEPTPVSSSLSIIWQVRNPSALRSNSPVYQLAAAYGDRFKVVACTAEELFHELLDPTLFGIGNAPSFAPSREAAFDAMIAQWRQFRLSTMPSDVRRKVKRQIKKDLREIKRAGGFRLKYDEPGSIAWRILVGQAASGIVDGYQKELEFLRRNAPILTLQRYERFALRLVLVRLLVSCRRFEEALRLSETAIDEITSAVREIAGQFVDPKTLRDLVDGDKTDLAVRRCYRQLKAQRALALISLGRADEGLNEVAFESILISRAFVSGEIWTDRTIDEAVLAEAWAVVTLKETIGVEKVTRSVERLQTFERA